MHQGNKSDAFRHWLHSKQLFHTTKEKPTSAHPNLENVAKIKHFQLALITCLHLSYKCILKGLRFLAKDAFHLNALILKQTFPYVSCKFSLKSRWGTELLLRGKRCQQKVSENINRSNCFLHLATLSITEINSRTQK